MTHNDLVAKMRDLGYYTTGRHYKLVSGMHSDAYLQVRLALMHPEILDGFSSISASLVRDLNPTCVAGFTIGGVLLAHKISLTLKIPLIVGRRKNREIEWIGDEVSNPNHRLVLVDDILTTASSLNLAISALEKSGIERVLSIIVAVDRTETLPTVTCLDNEVKILSCSKVALSTFNSTECPMCRKGIPPKDLSNPETDFISVLLSQPPDQGTFILDGYLKAYRLQEDSDLISSIDIWRPWLPVLTAGLPMSRLEEDSRVMQFISVLAEIANEFDIPMNTVSELIGKLIMLTSIRVESRSVGCSILIGDISGVQEVLESRARIILPVGASCRQLTNLVPLFDALLETNYVFLANQDGSIEDVRRLNIVSDRFRYLEGVQLLRHVTSSTSSIGFMIQRGRGTISVYCKGRLEAIGDLSEKTGIWEFSRPMDRVNDINEIVPDISELLIRAIEISRELVAKNYGGLFVIGDYPGLDCAEPKVEIEPLSLNDISTEDIVEFAKLDGAIFISSTQQVEKVGVIIRNKEVDSTISATKETHGGARKEAARRTSIECPKCAAIYVSQNGTIEIYVQGTSWPVSEVIEGLSR